MKKKLLMALTTSLVIAGLGTACAEEAADNAVKFDGNVTFHFRSQRDTDASDVLTKRNAFKTTLTLNATAPLSEQLDAYARFTFQYANDKDRGAFARDFFNKAGDSSSAAIDAYGFKYKNAGYTYVVGTQALTLGAGMAYDNGYVGKNALPYAINVSKKVGAVNLNVIAAETNYQNNIDNDKFYTVQGNYDVSAKTNLGAMVTYVDYGKDTATKYNLDKDATLFSLYGSHKLNDKATVSAEFLTSSVSDQNTGLQTSLSYKLDEKNGLGASYYYIEDQANLFDYNAAGITGWPFNNVKGVMVSWSHKFDKNTTLKLADFNYDTIEKDGGVSGIVKKDRNRLFANLSVNF